MPPVCPKCGEPVEPAPSVCRSCGQTFTVDVPPDGEVHLGTSISTPKEPSSRGCALVGGVLLVVVAYLNGTVIGPGTRR